MENYLEALLLEEKERRVVRTKDLAKRLGVTSPSVNAAVRELGNLGLVKHESYGHIELTPRGRKKAALVYARHKTLYRSLRRRPESAREDLGDERLRDGASSRRRRREEARAAPRIPQEKIRKERRVRRGAQGGSRTMTEKPLAELKPGESAEIVALNGGDEFQSRLRAMGLAEGQTVRKLSRIRWGGPIVLLVNRAQVAVGRGMARKIRRSRRGRERPKRWLTIARTTASGRREARRRADILLVGQPNVGKSVLFMRLTGMHTIASNYPGTTVGFTTGTMRFGGGSYTVVDAPGTYSLEPLDEAARVAIDLIDAAGLDYQRRGRHASRAAPPPHAGADRPGEARWSSPST